jgi:hypothetical protein
MLCHLWHSIVLNCGCSCIDLKGSAQRYVIVWVAMKQVLYTAYVHNAVALLMQYTTLVLFQ